MSEKVYAVEFLLREEAEKEEEEEMVYMRGHLNRLEKRKKIAQSYPSQLHRQSCLHVCMMESLPPPSH